MREIWCVHKCKGVKDYEFYEVFSRYCGHPRVL